MSAPDVEAIRARAEAATDGPWETVPTVGNAVVSPDGDGYWSDLADRIETEADAEFIAHAREDIPALLDEVERLREYIDRMPYPSDMDQLRADLDRAEATIARVRELADSWDRTRGENHRLAAGWLRAAIEGADS